MRPPSGDDWRTANPNLGRVVTEEVISSSPWIPPPRLVITADSPTELNSLKRRIGAGEFILVKEVSPGGRIAGGWRSMDERKKRLISWVLTVIFVAVLLLVGILYATFLVWAILQLIKGM